MHVLYELDRVGYNLAATINFLKVKTWTWHSYLTELAYLDVSKLSSNVPCLSNGKARQGKKKTREHLTFVVLLVLL